MKMAPDVTSGFHMHRYTDMHPSAHTGTYPQESTHAVHAHMYTNAHTHTTHTQRGKNCHCSENLGKIVMLIKQQ